MDEDIADEEVTRIIERLSEPTAAAARHDVCDRLLGTIESTDRLVACLDALARRCDTLHTLESRHLPAGSGTYRLQKVGDVLRALVWAIHDSEASSSGKLNHDALAPLWEASRAVLAMPNATAAPEGGA